MKYLCIFITWSIFIANVRATTSTTNTTITIVAIVAVAIVAVAIVAVAIVAVAIVAVALVNAIVISGIRLFAAGSTRITIIMMALRFRLVYFTLLIQVLYTSGVTTTHDDCKLKQIT